MASSHASAGHSPINRFDRSTKLLRVAISVDAQDSNQTELAIATWELVGVYNSSVEFQLDELAEEPWPGHDNRTLSKSRVEIVAYLAAEQWSELERSARAAAADLFRQEQTFQVRRLPNRDWRTAWQNHFNLVRVPGPRPIVIRPPHLSYDPGPQELVIDLVPGLAFGTGQHQSTRLCLGLLAELIDGGERVLDVGTGSGILAVAAVKLGAASVLATDIDPLAVDAARQTVRRNQIAERVEVLERSVPAGEQYDVIVANLTADILQDLSGDLSSGLKPGGRLVASGLITSRRSEVIRTFAAAGLLLEFARTEDEWVALSLSLP